MRAMARSLAPGEPVGAGTSTCTAATRSRRPSGAGAGRSEGASTSGGGDEHEDDGGRPAPPPRSRASSTGRSRRRRRTRSPTRRSPTRAAAAQGSPPGCSRGRPTRTRPAGTSRGATPGPSTAPRARTSMRSDARAAPDDGTSAPKTPMNSADTTTSAIQANSPNSRIQYRTAPKYPTPKANPSRRPRRGVARRRSHRSGISARSATGPRFAGGRASEHATPEARARSDATGRERWFAGLGAVATERPGPVPQLTPVLHQVAFLHTNSDDWGGTTFSATGSSRSSRVRARTASSSSSSSAAAPPS